MDRASGTLATVLLVAALQACTGDEGDPENRGSGPSATLTRPGDASAPPTRTSAPTLEPSLDDKVDEARVILSRDEGKDLDAITVVSAESVQWPNSAYGCPLTDATYTPGPFAGYRIVLEANGQSYIYTGAEDTDPRRCLFLD